MNKWLPTQIEQLEPFDIVLHASSVWVIQRISRVDKYQYFDVTRVDDGKKSKWTFHPESFGYSMEKLFKV